MSTTEHAFYDLALTGDGEPAMLPLEDSPWRELYERAAALIHPSHPVVDLGCGTGRFAEQLRQLEHHGGYLGIDFSPKAIRECRAYVRRRDRATGWRARFQLADLRDWQPAGRRAGATSYVCLETLEHLDDDVDLIRRIPPGHELIFSVPNYPSAAHLRVFHDAGDIWRRYGELLAMKSWTLIGEETRFLVHLCRAIRRGDAW